MVKKLKIFTLRSYGGSVTMPMSPNELEMMNFEKGSEVVLEIKDNGCRIISKIKTIGAGLGIIIPKIMLEKSSIKVFELVIAVIDKDNLFDIPRFSFSSDVEGVKEELKEEREMEILNKD